MTSRSVQPLSLKSNSSSSTCSGSDSEEMISRVSSAVSGTAYVTKRLLKSTGKAAWIAGTAFLILALPLIIEMDREQQLNDLDLQQASLLGTPPPIAADAAAPK